MNLIKIDAVGLKPFETRLECVADILRSGAFLTFAHSHAKFRGNDCACAPAFESSTEKLLALSSPVDVCGIEKVNAAVQRGIDHCGCSSVIRPPTEVVASDADKRHLERSNGAVFHECVPLPPRRLRRRLPLFQGGE